MTITSQHNPALKQLRRLARKHDRERSGRFAAEGEDLIAAAELAGRHALAGYRVAGSGLGGGDFVDVEASALTAVSTLGSGTRVIGVYEQRWATAPSGPLCVYLHGVGDPGNVGTVLRSAKAFGASSVALGPGCADPHAPKAVRASMGAIFVVEIAREGLPPDVVSACERTAHIPIEADSLNAAMAATVALYEMTMRSHPPGRDHDTVTTK